MSELANIAQQFSGLPMESLIGGPLVAAAEANSRMAQAQVDFMLATCFNTQDVTRQIMKDGILIKETVKVRKPIMVDLNLTIPAKSVYERNPMLDKLAELKLLDNNITSNQKEINEAIKNINERGSVILTKYIPSYDLQFSLPILTIIPLNALAVLSVDINFEMEVKSSFEETVKEKSESKAAGEIGFEGEVGFSFAKVSIKGSASYSSTESKERDTHYSKSNNAKYTVNVKAGQLPTPDGIKTILDIYTKNIFPAGEEPEAKPIPAVAQS